MSLTTRLDRLQVQMREISLAMRDISPKTSLYMKLKKEQDELAYLIAKEREERDQRSSA